MLYSIQYQICFEFVSTEITITNLDILPCKYSKAKKEASDMLLHDKNTTGGSLETGRNYLIIACCLGKEAPFNKAGTGVLLNTLFRLGFLSA